MFGSKKLQPGADPYASWRVGGSDRSSRRLFTKELGEHRCADQPPPLRIRLGRLGENGCNRGFESSQENLSVRQPPRVSDWTLDGGPRSVSDRMSVSRLIRRDRPKRCVDQL